MKKTFTLFFITIVTIASIYALIRYVGMQNFPFSFACWLNFILLAGARTFTETLKSRFTSSYFNEQAWERGGKIYERLGINFYRKLLVAIGWERYITKKYNPVEKNTEALIHLHYETKHGELGHIITLIIVLGFTIFVAFKFGASKSLWLLILNIILNLYPVLLQRYNRPRIERAINLSHRR